MWGRHCDDLLARAEAFYRAQQYDQAAICCREALAYDPTHVRSRLGLADSLVAGGWHQAAVDGLVEGATVVRASGNTGGAGALLGKALELDPGRLELHVDIAEIELADGRALRAQQRLESLARTYTQRGMHEDADAILEVIREWTKNPFSEPVHTMVAPSPLLKTMEIPPERLPEPVPAPKPEANHEPAPLARPRRKRRSRVSAILEVRPKAPPIAKPRTPLHGSASERPKRSAASTKAARPKMAEIPAPASGRPVSGASVDAKLRLETMRKAAKSRLGELALRDPQRPNSAHRRAPGSAAMASPSSNLAERLKQRANAVIPEPDPTPKQTQTQTPSSVATDDELTRLWNLAMDFDPWDEETRVFAG